ncbi:MAG: M1 family metallopeptidase [Gelidibacter sp.]|nr:M1 family metallopeptidase [Gelidibacter sp.]
MMKFYTLILFLLAFQSVITAQNYLQRFNEIDVKHYNLVIEVNDSTNNIQAKMTVSLTFKQLVNEFHLDLVQKDSTGKGMNIESVFQNNDTVQFIHSDNKITIQPNFVNTDSIFNFEIKYSGIPKDGLIIGENLHGDRTFFADNWPNRAHNWFPCVDHPSDKATVAFTIKAPNHYQVIANGTLVEETNLTDDLKLYHYKTIVPLPTKVMVIGIAQFAVQHIGETHHIPVSTWVYPQTKEKGFYDFANSKSILNFFIEKFGEYPFQKLANVQSKTQFGGMENAGAIFYFEKIVNGEQNHEDTIAHEIAHQWFGNSASETDWPHIWLSEGFANYFTSLYILKTKGEGAFQQRIKEERETVLNFYKKNQTPVIDTKNTNLMSLLNANSYEKGAWVLHMLRKKLGDEIFWKGIRTYYEKFKFSNASTNDFKNVMKEVSDQNLDSFFTQWLQNAGHPVLKTSWLYYQNKLRLLIDQTQETSFQFPLDVEIIYSDGTSEIKTIEISKIAIPYEIETKGEVKDVKFDPNTWLLFEIAS